MRKHPNNSLELIIIDDVFMKKRADIANKNDIEILINAFYEKVKKDALLSVYFEHTNWKKHLPIMYIFWENIILFSGDYSGNPMAKHKHIHHKNPLSKKHFNRWMTLFKASVNEHFEGPKANLTLERAESIGQVMMANLFTAH